ncbi:MAG: methylthioribulose 1-phosphate dehydratase [Vicinamibacterales bacterium]
MPSSHPRGFRDISLELARIGERFYARNWVLGTSGNFSAVVSLDPLRLAITPSAAHKGALTGREILEIGADAQVVGSATGRPSAEALLHLEIVRRREARAVLHTHSVWGTILSDLHVNERGLMLEGYEMLKGLDGISTHEHQEWVPIIANDQDMPRLAQAVGAELAAHTGAHAFLLCGHGLYTWGATLAEAERHVEILEFLFETVGRRNQYGHRHHP